MKASVGGTILTQRKNDFLIVDYLRKVHGRLILIAILTQHTFILTLIDLGDEAVFQFYNSAALFGHINIMGRDKEGDPLFLI